MQRRSKTDAEGLKGRDPCVPLLLVPGVRGGESMKGKCSLGGAKDGLESLWADGLQWDHARVSGLARAILALITSAGARVTSTTRATMFATDRAGGVATGLSLVGVFTCFLIESLPACGKGGDSRARKVGLQECVVVSNRIVD
jgi:hypothetical protein